MNIFVTGDDRKEPLRFKEPLLHTVYVFFAETMPEAQVKRKLQIPPTQAISGFTKSSHNSPIFHFQLWWGLQEADGESENDPCAPNSWTRTGNNLL